jgi:putative oxidoreductase
MKEGLVKFLRALRLQNNESRFVKGAVLLGRICYSAIFILASVGHFSRPTIAWAASQGVPMASILVPLSGLIALLGGISILLGFKARCGAWLVIIFLVPVTFTLHPFWAETDPMMSSMQQTMFLKNLSMIGAALLIAHFGSGPCSIDKK